MLQKFLSAVRQSQDTKCVAVAMLFVVLTNVAISFAPTPDACAVEGAVCFILLAVAYMRFIGTHGKGNAQASKEKAAKQEAAYRRHVNSDYFNFQADIARAVKAGNLQKAEVLLDEMRNLELSPSVQIYSQVASGWIKHNNIENADRVLETMIQDNCRPDIMCISLMVHTYATHRDLENAEKWHSRIEAYNLIPDRACFSRIINACAKTGNINRAMHYLEAMKSRGIEAEVITFSSILDACANAGDLEQAKLVFIRMRASGVALNAVPYACLGRIYAGRGMVDDVERLFQDMMDRGIAMNEYTLCTLLTAYGRSSPREMAKAEKAFRAAVNAGITVNGKVLVALRQAVSRDVFIDLQMLVKGEGGATIGADFGRPPDRYNANDDPWRCSGISGASGNRSSTDTTAEQLQ